MRIQAKLKLGYYPLALAEARRIRNYLQFPEEPASILDDHTALHCFLHAIALVCLDIDSAGAMQ